MSAAEVKFYDADGYTQVSPDKAVRFGFTCPKGRGHCVGLLIAGRTPLKRDGQGKNGGVPMWDFDGNAEAPTFTPSVNCGSCWHGFIERGRCVDTSRRDEPEPVK